jgi:hypothetical protein
MGKHDPAAADPQAGRTRRNLADHDLGTGTGKAGQAVMLGNPVALIAQRFGRLGQGDRFAQRVSSSPALTDRRLINNA